MARGRVVHTNLREQLIVIADLNHADVATYQLFLLLRAEREPSEHPRHVRRMERIVERLTGTLCLRVRLVAVWRRAVVVGEVQLRRRERRVRRVREPALDRGEQRGDGRLRRERGLAGRREG